MRYRPLPYFEARIVRVLFFCLLQIVSTRPRDARLCNDKSTLFSVTVVTVRIIHRMLYNSPPPTRPHLPSLSRSFLVRRRRFLASYSPLSLRRLKDTTVITGHASYQILLASCPNDITDRFLPEKYLSSRSDLHLSDRQTRYVMLYVRGRVPKSLHSRRTLIGRESASSLHFRMILQHTGRQF